MGEQDGLMDVNMYDRLPFLSKKENDTFPPASKVSGELINLTEIRKLYTNCKKLDINIELKPSNNPFFLFFLWHFS